MPKPYMTWVASPHHGRRPRGPDDISAIVLHHTASGGTPQSVAQWFANPASKVSAHFIVGKDGSIVRCVLDDRAAWHAGNSAYGGRRNVNDFSIGIEICNKGDGHDPYSDPQYVALADLIAWLCVEHRIPTTRIVGHRDIALPKGRKTDPSNNFNWPWLLEMVSRRLKPAALSPVPPPAPSAPPPVRPESGPLPSIVDGEIVSSDPQMPQGCADGRATGVIAALEAIIVAIGSAIARLKGESR